MRYTTEETRQKQAHIKALALFKKKVNVTCALIRRGSLNILAYQFIGTWGNKGYCYYLKRKCKNYSFSKLKNIHTKILKQMFKK